MADWHSTTRPSKFHGFIFSEMNDNLSGPLKYPRFTAITNVPDSESLIGVTEDNKVLWTDLEKLRDGKFDLVDPDPFLDVTQDSFEPSGTEMVIASEDGAFSYYGQKIPTPFDTPEAGTLNITDPLCFNDAYLSIAETGPIHLGSEHEIKQLHEVLISFKTNSVGHLWCYAQNEDGDVKGQYKGSIHGKHRIKTFLNLRGREFKIRIYLATHISHPWQIQEMALGHLLGKAYT